MYYNINGIIFFKGYQKSSEHCKKLTFQKSVLPQLFTTLVHVYTFSFYSSFIFPVLKTRFTGKKQEDNGPHCSTEKPVQINEYI